MSYKCSGSAVGPVDGTLKSKEPSFKVRNITRNLSVVATDLNSMPYLFGTYKHRTKSDCPDIQACRSIVFHEGTQKVLCDSGMCCMILPTKSNSDLIIVCQPCRRFFLQTSSYVTHLRIDGCMPCIIEPNSTNSGALKVSSASD